MFLRQLSRVFIMLVCNENSHRNIIASDCYFMHKPVHNAITQSIPLCLNEGVS